MAVDQTMLWNDVKDGEIYPHNEKWYSHLLDQYKLYVEMADRISQRRTTADSYFLSVNSAILASVGYLTEKKFCRVFVASCRGRCCADPALALNYRAVQKPEHCKMVGCPRDRKTPTYQSLRR